MEALSSGITVAISFVMQTGAKIDYIVYGIRTGVEKKGGIIAN